MHDLALALGVSVKWLWCDISQIELLGWVDYLDRNPLGHREDYRAANIMGSFGVKRKDAEACFPSFMAKKAGLERHRSQVGNYDLSSHHLSEFSKVVKNANSKRDRTSL